MLRKILIAASKTLVITAINLALFVIEGLIVYILYLAYKMMNHDFPPPYFDPWRDIFGLIWTRTLFYIVPQVTLYYHFGKGFILRKGLLTISTFNVFVFVVIAVVVMILLNDSSEWVDTLHYMFLEPPPFMYTLILAVSLSPWILNKFSFFRRLLIIWSKID